MQRSKKPFVKPICEILHKADMQTRESKSGWGEKTDEASVAGKYLQLRASGSCLELCIGCQPRPFSPRFVNFYLLHKYAKIVRHYHLNRIHTAYGCQLCHEITEILYPL